MENKRKNKEYIIGIISILLLASSISIFVPFISNHVSKHSKNSLLSFKKKYSLIRASNNSNQTPWTLINKLYTVVDYITNSVITNQNKLKYMILGEADNKDGKSQSFQLATLNKFSSIIGINKYSRDAENTINNSIKKLQREDKKINSIISIIKNHPYTYQSYLCNDGIIIPNVDFFFNEGENITNFKVNQISNNLYTISNSNLSINSLSLSTEEATFSAKAISKSSLSLEKVLFNNTSFIAKIISFNTRYNEYQFVKTTKKDKLTKNNVFKTNLSKINNSQFIKSIRPVSGNYSYPFSYRILLTQSISKNYIILVNSGIFAGNNYLSNNSDSKSKDKKLVYLSLLIAPFICVPFIFHFSWRHIRKGTTPETNSTRMVTRNPEEIFINYVEKRKKERFVNSVKDLKEKIYGYMSKLDRDLSAVESYELLIDKEIDYTNYGHQLSNIESNLLYFESIINPIRINEKNEFKNILRKLNMELDKLKDRFIQLKVRLAIERVKQRNQEQRINSESLSTRQEISHTSSSSEASDTLERRITISPVNKTQSSQREIEIQELHNEADEYLYSLMLFKEQFVLDNKVLYVSSRGKYLEKKHNFLKESIAFGNKIISESKVPLKEIGSATHIPTSRGSDIIRYAWITNFEMRIQEDKILTRLL